MRGEKRAWVQAALDVQDMHQAVDMALMAKWAGAEWIEVGTQLLFAQGHRATEVIRQTVGKDMPIVCDYKMPNLRLVIDFAERYGANYVMMVNSYDDYSVKDAVHYGEVTGVKPIVVMDVPFGQLAARAKHLQQLGVEHIFIHHHYEEIAAKTGRRSCDGVSDVAGAISVPLGVSSDNYDEALEAVRQGADWITFGHALRTLDRELCKKWIDGIHNAHVSKE